MNSYFNGKYELIYLYSSPNLKRNIRNNTYKEYNFFMMRYNKLKEKYDEVLLNYFNNYYKIETSFIDILNDWIKMFSGLRKK